MRKLKLILCSVVSLSMILLVSCAKSNDTPREGEAGAVTPSVAPLEETTVNETRVSVNYGSVKRKTEEYVSLILSKQWEELASCFSDAVSGSYNASELAERFALFNERTLTLKECDPVLRDDVTGAICILQDEAEQEYECAFALDGELRIVKLECAERNISVEAEESEDWTEYVITAGNAPKINGVLTLPNDKENAPVAMLFPEGLNEPYNASGSNQEFRRDLAHLLAENGVASVRFDMRLYEDPLLTSVFGFDLDRIWSEDFASITHSLEQYPVNAGKIVYIGHGVAGALGYSAVNHHFEITGGLVLLNAPYEDSGAVLLARELWLSEEDQDAAIETLRDETSEVQEILGYPVSYWKQWDENGALRYTRYVAIPILILQGESDTIVTQKENYERWKSQKGSNVTMKTYKNIGHDMRNEDGEFEALIAEDIADWLNGIDINKKKTASTTATTTAGTGRKT